MNKKTNLLVTTIVLSALSLLISCSNSSTSTGKKIPKVGFLDMLEDATLAQAKKGFFVALNDSGFSPTDGTLEIIYRNAQNDQPTLLQACDYLISENVDLIATNPSLATITAVQRTKTIPVFMMVSPRPDIAKLTDNNGNAPVNLFGVYETLDYIDTSILLVKTVLPNVKIIGTIYNQTEPQSVDALALIEKRCSMMGIKIEKLPVNNSNEAQLVVAALLDKNIDAFFALPDNTVFSAMEVIVKSCDDAKVPVFTSEEGLVKRGALAAFGTDMYQWGYQSGAQAAAFLKTGSTDGLSPELAKIRRRVCNQAKADFFGLSLDSTFIRVNP
jgi:putative ABC transport system substrate-binding protein